MSKKVFALIGTFLFVSSLFAGESSLVWVFFKDKGFTSKSTYNESLEIARNALSPEALRRREKVLSAQDVVGWRDVPVCRTYVEKIERLGARHRVSSNWLNCASFEMDSQTVKEVRDLPFVKETKSVAVYTKGTPRFEFTPPKGSLIKAPQGLIYGLSFDQLNILGVPDAHSRGYTGAGVRIGILDSGFELRHRAFSTDSLRLDLVAEHDFVSGEHLWFEGTSTPVNYYQVENIDAWQDLSGYVYVAFEVIDSSLNQEIYYTRSLDGGGSWSSPENISGWEAGNLAHPTHPDVLSSGDSVLVAWQDKYNAYGLNEDIFIWHSVPNTVVNVSQDITESLWPALGRTAGNFQLVWAGGNNLIHAQSSDGLVWARDTAMVLANSIACLSLAANGDSLFVAVVDDTHELFRIQSTDGGVTWSDTSVGVHAEAPDISVSAGRFHLVHKNREDFPLYNITCRNSDDWNRSVDLFTDPRPAIGRVRVASSEDSVWVIYEDHGHVCLFRWSAGTMPVSGLVPDTLTPNGFCYCPELTQSGHRLWKSCGDDTTRDQAGDIEGQQYHGTAMLSLIGGYTSGQLYGPAFNAQFILAKTEKISTLEGVNFEYEVEEDWWVKGIEWTEGLGADIVSSSLGYRFVSYDELDGNSAVTTRAADVAASLGVLILNAVGNRRQGAYTLEPQDALVAPADADSILSVGATNSSGQYDGMAGYGPLVDGRDKPEVATNHVARIAHYKPTEDGQPPDSFSYTSGTSCATALVAGMCALVLEANPSWTNHDLREAVMYTASLGHTVNPDTMPFGNTPNDSLGWGVPNVIRTIEYKGNRERIVDGGLENWKTSNKLSMWKTTGDSVDIRTVSQESVNVYEGMYSAKVTAFNNADSNSVSIYQDIKTGKRCEYQLTCWIKYTARTSGKVRVIIHDLEDSLIIESREISSLQADGMLLEFRFVTDNPSTRVEVGLAEEVEGTVYLDGISVYYLGPVPEIPPEFEERIIKIYPNPFIRNNPDHSTIRFKYILTDHACPNLRIYTLSGKLVYKEDERERTPGRYEIEWTPPSDLASGVYIVALRTSFTTLSRKFAIIR